MILSVTGHRPDKLGGYRIPNPVYNEVIQRLDIALMTLRPDKVITGMALGVDQWVAELCVKNDLPFIAAIPFQNFSTPWPDFSRAHYEYLLSKAERVHLCSTNTTYSPDLLFVRNQWMVDNSDELLAVRRPDLVESRTGGTIGTMDYARRRRRTIHVVNLSAEASAIALNEEILIEQRRRARQGVSSPAPAPTDVMGNLALQGAINHAGRATSRFRLEREQSPVPPKPPKEKPPKEESRPYKRVIELDFD